MASVPIMVVENVINKAQEKGKAVMNGRISSYVPGYGLETGELREKYAASNDGNTFILRHWGTEILNLDLKTKAIVSYYGESKSDSDAIQTALLHFGIKGNAHYYPSTDTFIITDNDDNEVPTLDDAKAWLKSQQQTGAFVGFPEATIDFDTLDNSDLAWYANQWYSAELEA